jgi:hypothetical protein
MTPTKKIIYIYIYFLASIDTSTQYFSLPYFQSIGPCPTRNMKKLGILNTLERIFTRCIRSDNERFHLSGPSTLPTLPLELLLHVVHYLPLSSVALLALCSKLLWIKLGSKYFEQLKKGKHQLNIRFVQRPTFTKIQEQRSMFLSLLERDMDEMIFFYFCQKLHKSNNSPLHQREGTTCLAVDSAWPDGYHGATFSRLYFAMRCYRKGLDISHTLDSLLLTLTEYGDNWTRQMSFAARVVSKSLYLRTQHWILLPSKRPLELPTSFHWWKLCYHVRTIQGAGPEKYPLVQSLQNRFCEYQQFGTDAMHWTHLEQCIMCRTEFQIDIKDIGHRGTAVVITVWQDFGEVLTPFELTWGSHFFPFPHDSLRSIPSRTRGSLKDAFEGGRFDFDAHQTEISAAKFRIKRRSEPPVLHK